MRRMELEGRGRGRGSLQARTSPQPTSFKRPSLPSVCMGGSPVPSLGPPCPSQPSPPGCPLPSGCVAHSLQAEPRQACSGHHPRARTVLATLLIPPPWLEMTKGPLLSTHQEGVALGRKLARRQMNPTEPILAGIRPRHFPCLPT